MLRFVFLGLIAVVTVVALLVGLRTSLHEEREIPPMATYETSAGTVRVDRVAGPFAHPWALAFLPGGAVLITERGGRLWRLGADGQRTEVLGVPDVHAVGQGGLLDVVAARDFATSREVFLTYSEPVGDKSRSSVAAARLSEDGKFLETLHTIFRQTPPVDSQHHYGSRIVQGRDGTLWVTLGERGMSTQAQNLATDLGKVVRIARDGTVPEDNPFVGGIGRPEIWSYGHRNPQGATMDPETGALWTVEHGAKGGDEINKPQAGKNYGWPVISYGTTYAGTRIGEGTHKKGMEQPIYYWDPSIAPSGMLIYSGRLWPEWKGDIFVGALKFQLISRLHREGDVIKGEERLLTDAYGRIRDVREGPDGAIWFLTDEEAGALYRMAPAK